MGGVSRWTSPHSVRRASICDPSAALGLVVGVVASRTLCFAECRMRTSRDTFSTDRGE